MVHMHASHSNAASRPREHEVRSATSSESDSDSSETTTPSENSACGNLPESNNVDYSLDEAGGLSSTPLAFALPGNSAELHCLDKNTNLQRVNKILTNTPLPAVNKVRTDRRMFRAGDYWLGPYLGSSPVNSVVQCLARKIGTDEFYTMKILTIYEGEDETQDDRQGKMLLHTEHSLLSMLKDTPGVIKMHALFQDYAFDCVRRCAQRRPSHISASQRLRKRHQQQNLVKQRTLSSRLLRSFSNFSSTSSGVLSSQQSTEGSENTSTGSHSISAASEVSDSVLDETQTRTAVSEAASERPAAANVEQASEDTGNIPASVINDSTSSFADNDTSAVSSNETAASEVNRISNSTAGESSNSVEVETVVPTSNETPSFTSVENSSTASFPVPNSASSTGPASSFSNYSSSESSASGTSQISLTNSAANASPPDQSVETVTSNGDQPQVTSSVTASFPSGSYNSTTFTFINPIAVPVTSNASSVFALPSVPPPPSIRSSSNFSSARSSTMQSSRQQSFGLSRGRYFPAPYRQTSRRHHHRRLQGTDSYWLRAREVARHRRILDESRRSRGSISLMTPSSYRSSVIRDTMDGRRSSGRSFVTGHSSRYIPVEDWMYDASEVSDPRELECLYTGRIVRRLCLVLDCVTPHEFSEKTDHLMNLQHYVIARQALPEIEALTILYHTAVVVHSIHEKNIVHRDLKLGNLVVERGSGRVILTNLCLGQYLMPGMPKLQDQRGSPAYISPDVLSAQPYRGKPSDMWSLGVVLFTMLYGHFPFYDKVPHELFKKIKAAKYIIPRMESVKEDTVELIHSLLEVDPATRYTSAQLLACLSAIIPAKLALEARRVAPRRFQVVPDVDDRLKEALKRRSSPSGPINLVSPDATPSPSMVPMSGSNSFPSSGPSLSSDAVSASYTSTSGPSSRLTSSLTSPFDRDRPPQRLHQQLQQLQIITPNRLLLSTSPNPDEIQVVPEVNINAPPSSVSVSCGLVNAAGQNSNSNLASSPTSNAFLPSLFSVNSSRGSGFTPLFRNHGASSLLGDESSVAVSTSAPTYQAVPSAEIRVSSSSDFIVPATLSASLLDQSLYPISSTESNPHTNSSPLIPPEPSDTQVHSPLSESLSFPAFSFAASTAMSSSCGSEQSPATVMPAATPPMGGLRWSSPCCSEGTSTVAARTAPSTSAEVQQSAIVHPDATDLSDLDALIHAMKQERLVRGSNSSGSSKDYCEGARDPPLPPMAPLSTASRAGTSLIPHTYGDLAPLTPEQLLALRDLLPPLPEFGSSVRPRSLVSSSSTPPLSFVSVADSLNSNPFWQRLGVSRLMPPIRTSSNLSHPWSPWPSRPTTEGLSRLVLSRQQLQQNNDLANLSLSLSSTSSSSSLVVTTSSVGVSSSLLPSASNLTSESNSTSSSFPAFTMSVLASTEGTSRNDSNTHQLTSSSSGEAEVSSSVLTTASPTFTTSISTTNSSTTTSIWPSSSSDISTTSTTGSSSSSTTSAYSSNSSSSSMNSTSSASVLNTSTSSYRTAARSSSRRRARARRTASATPYHINLRPRRGSVFPGENSLLRRRASRSSLASARAPPRLILSSDDDSMEEMSPPPANRGETAATRADLVEDASSSSSSD